MFFRYHGFGHFQVDYPNLRTLTIREVEELPSIKEDDSEESLRKNIILW